MKKSLLAFVAVLAIVLSFGSFARAQCPVGVQASFGVQQFAVQPQFVGLSQFAVAQPIISQPQVLVQSPVVFGGGFGLNAVVLGRGPRVVVAGRNTVVVNRSLFGPRVVVSGGVGRTAIVGGRVVRIR